MSYIIGIFGYFIVRDILEEADLKEILIVEDKSEERQCLKLLIERMGVGAKVYMAAEEEKTYSVAMKYSIDLF